MNRILRLMILFILSKPSLLEARMLFSQLESQADTIDQDLKNPKLSGWLKSGEFSFHGRSYSMATRNKGDLTDYYASAIGAGLAYKSPSLYGLEFHFGGFFVFPVFVSDIVSPDPLTGNGNRYELLLFDMNNPTRRNDLDRLEELYISYGWKGWKMQLGRQAVHGPLLNEQDNRMRPNLFSGLHLKYHDKGYQFQSAWLTRVTIRGTIDWYRMEESLGVYPFGRNPMGMEDSYRGEVSSPGLWMSAFHWHGSQDEIQVYNYWAWNIFLTQWFQWNRLFRLNKHVLAFGLQASLQHPHGQGGNAIESKRYILPEERSHSLGARLAYKMKGHSLSLNHLYISEQGRFLFPREWGREQFFASLPRERYEGSAGLQAYTLKWQTQPSDRGLSNMLGLGWVKQSPVEDIAKNKYGVPSYWHYVLSLDYAFQGDWEGLEIQLMGVHKRALERRELSDVFRINRVDLWNLNCVIDYRF